MSEHGHCYDCGGDDGNHFDGCTYEGTGEVGESYSFSRGSSSNAPTGRWWVLYIIALLIGYGISEFLGVIILIGLIFWAAVS